MTRPLRRKPKIRDDTKKKRRVALKIRKKKGANKKVKNAVCLEVDGIKFRSKLEVYAYKALREADIPFEYEKHKFDLLPSFTYKDEKIRGASYKPDFVGDGWIIETKGYATDVFNLRWKLFKFKLFSEGKDIDLYLPKTHEQVNNAIAKIMEKNAARPNDS